METNNRVAYHAVSQNGFNFFLLLEQMVGFYLLPLAIQANELQM